MGSHTALNPRRGGLGGLMPSQEEQSPAQRSAPLSVTDGSITACFGLFGQIIAVQKTSSPLPLTLAASKWAARRSKSLYPITSLLSHACLLASYILFRWQLNGKEVALPIRRQ